MEMQNYRSDSRLGGLLLGGKEQLGSFDESFVLFATRLPSLGQLAS